MAFQDRQANGSEFENALFDELQRMGFITAKNGTEHTSPDFVKRLHNSSDQTSMAIRFQPDGVASIGRVPRSFFVEAKTSKSIEFQAYTQYNKLIANGNIVVVVFKYLDYGWRWCYADKIPLIPGEDSVADFPPEKRFPVIDGWLYPRRSYHSNYGGGSGTPFRYIRYNELKLFDTFRNEIIKKLSQ